MTQFVKRLVSLFATVLILAACASPSGPSPTTEVTSLPTNNVSGGDLVNTQWVLEAFNEGGEEPPSFSTVLPYLEFRENGEAGGSGGCNTFSTQYEVQLGEISFGPIASTKMSCTIDIMQEELMFFDALGSANRYEVSGDTLRIWYANEQNILLFSRTTLDRPAEATSWSTMFAPANVEPTLTSGLSGNANVGQRIHFTPSARSVTIPLRHN